MIALLRRHAPRTRGGRRVVSRCAARLVSIALAGFAASLCHAASPSETLVLEVRVDGRTESSIEPIDLRDGTLWASAQIWRRCGVELPDEIGDGQIVALRQMEGAVADIDRAQQTLRLHLPPSLMHLQALGSAQASAPATPESAARVAPPGPPPSEDTGAFVNYDARAHGTSMGERPGVGSLFDLHAFSGRIALSNGVVWSDIGRQAPIRLDTTLGFVDESQLRRVDAGDVLTGGPEWSRPVRLLGLKASTDFSLRPDLVTTPVPRLTGSAAVPSSVDVFVNGVRQLSQPVEAGRFELRELPSASGAGSVAVVVRDALGRESLQTLPFYAAPDALGKDVRSFDVQAGRVRTGYGTAQSSYGLWAASGGLRQGLGDGLTLDAHTEFAQGGYRMAGTGALLAWPGLGAVHASVAASQSPRRDGGSGAQSALRLERQSPRGSVMAELRVAGSGYRDIAAAAGDPVVRRQLRASAAIPIAAWGSIGAVYLRQQRAPGPAQTGSETRIATLTYGVALSHQWQLLATGYRDFGSAAGANFAGGAQPRTQGATLGLTYAFGSSGSAGSSVERSTGRGWSGALQASHSALEPGQWGWQLRQEQSSQADFPRHQVAAARYRAGAGEFGTGVETVDGRRGWEATAEGAWVALGGDLRASSTVHDCVALVDAGIPGVSVFRANRFVGRTDSHGRLIVPDLVAYEPNEIGLEARELPLDVDVEAVTRVVRSRSRSGAWVRFGARGSRSALVRLVDRSGAPLPVGATVRVGTSTSDHVVGYDGEAWLDGLDAPGPQAPSQPRLFVSLHGRALCSAYLEGAARDPLTRRIGPVTCE